MNILITGADGQVGRELVLQLQNRATVLAANRAALDITDSAAVERTVAGFRPDVIINAAADTAVQQRSGQFRHPCRRLFRRAARLANRSKRIGAKPARQRHICHGSNGVGLAGGRPGAHGRRAICRTSRAARCQRGRGQQRPLMGVGAIVARQ